jgi:hypothetical protein
MPLVRGFHSFDDHFTQIPNEWLRDSRLTFKARGLLAMLLSHSEGWSLSIAAIAEQNQEGKDAIRSAIAELQEFGYLSRSQVNDNGRFGEAVWVTQDPTATPLAGFPSSGFPSSGNPTPKNNNLKEEQLTNTTKNISAHLFTEFWNEYPRKLDKGKAKRAFASALTRATFEDILAGAIRYKNDQNRLDEFTKYPASWLNADSWENGPLPDDPRAAKQREAKEQQRLMKEWGNLESE